MWLSGDVASHLGMYTCQGARESRKRAGEAGAAAANCLTRNVWACRQGSNPLKMGVPKRVPSLNTQVEGNCKELGGDRAIHRHAAA